MKQDFGKGNYAEEKKMNRMDCAQFQEVLHDLDRPGTHGATLCERALAHAEMCSPCATLLTEVESLDFSLHQLAEESVDLQAPPRLETLLLQEFRRERSAAAARGMRWQLAAFAVAAAVLLALGLTLNRQHLMTPAGGAASAQASADLRAAKTPDAAAASDADRAVAVASAAQAGAASAKPAQSSGSDDAEYATAYMPLPYASDPSGLEGGAVVRVVLPRAALVSYGVPVEGMGVRDQVTADMVVSQDGTPQAIRLVAQANTNSDF
jgi:hypothetical protein